MKFISKFKVDKILFISLLIMIVISITTIYSAGNMLGSPYTYLYQKQIIWYVAGFGLIYLIMSVGNKWIYENIWYFYWLFVLLLAYLLFFGTPINQTKAWFVIPKIGSFQPSEFMKIILIITLGKVLHDFNTDYKSPTLKDEFKLILKIALIVFIPSILTFLEPDTGVVLIYLVIAFFMLFISGIRYRWFIFIIALFIIALGSVISIYYFNTDLFIRIFGTDFFLRVDRILDWSIKSGYQLENSLNAIGSGGIFGNGFNNTPVYFPEAHTDFIFAVFASNFGIIGSTFLILNLLIFDFRIIGIASKNKSNTDKYIAAGIIGMLFYQQFQNISMTFGLMPITGITLPFISYGGSSLLSYMIIAGILFNISNYTIRKTK